MYNFEPQGLPTFEERLRSGPLPRVSQCIGSYSRLLEVVADVVKKIWLQVMISVDQSLSLLHGSAQGRGLKSADWNSERLKHRIEDIEQNMKLVEETTQELTGVEQSTCRLILSITEAAVLLREDNLPTSSTHQSQSQRFEGLIEEVRVWLGQNLEVFNDITRKSPENFTQSLADRQLPCSWLYFHRAFSTLEALQGTALFLRFAKGFSKRKPNSGIFLAKERQVKIRENVLELEKKIHDHARYLKSELERPGFFDILDIILERNDETAGKIGVELQETIELTEMEECLGQMKESWLEGLAAITKVKVGKTQ